MATTKKTCTPVKPATRKPTAGKCAAAACACKGAAKPAAKPAIKPAVKAAGKPVAKAAAKPVAKPTAKTPAKPQAPRAEAPSSRAPDRQSVTFALRADPGSLVAVAGSFNNWDPLRNPLTDAEGTGNYRATIPLEPGAYEYKFVVNGTWCVDPNCPDWSQNEFGTLNSICKV